MSTAQPAGPALSVIIAAYNAEATLDAELDALRRQDVDFEWEILVCDNGSSDRTADIVRRRMTEFPCLRLVDASRRRGPGAARNDGARAARAPRLAFCDADDVVADDWVHEMNAALSTHPFVTGNSRRLELNSRPDDPRYFDWSLYRVPFFPYLDGAGSGNMGIHKAVFDEMGGFDETLLTGEDLDLCWRVQIAGYPLAAHRAAIVNVSNREGLRKSFTQAFAYGVGDRRLMHKYALVAEAYQRDVQGNDTARGGDPATQAAEASDASTANSRVRRVLKKVFRLRALSDLTDVTHRTASAIGFRFGRIDRGAPKITPPPKLPEPRRGPI